VALVLAGLAACSFEPDLSRFSACATDGSCPTGTTCLVEAQRCLPDCGEQGPCFPEEPEPPAPDAATDAGADGGLADSGTVDSGTVDSGTVDSGTADSGTVDSGTVDSGTVDSGTADAGVTDGGSGSDGGADAGEVLTLEPATLEVATETLAYSHTFRARGGTAPYTFRAVQGVPPGLTLQSGGALTGSPTQPGDYQLTVEVSDSSTPRVRVEATHALRVRPRLRLAGPLILADAPQGETYAEKLSATGGITEETKPYRFTLEGGQFPQGLNLAEDGTVTGKAAQVGGPFTFQVRVTDADTPAQSVVESVSISVFSTLSLGARITTRALPSARRGQPYHYVLRAWGVSSPKWELPNGTPPDGITFDANTGVLSGEPAGASRSFTVRLAAGLTPPEEVFSITVD
jgi:hypothetical protein